MLHRGIKGPRPLSLHFANSSMIWDEAAKVGSKSLEQDIWNEALQEKVRALQEKLALVGHVGTFDALVKLSAQDRKDSFVQGINKYVSLPYVPQLSTTTICHKIGCVSLHDFGGKGTPILLAPSLVNPYYILDLMPGRSLAVYLREHGYRPFLLDWGSPGEQEYGFGIDDYVVQRFRPMLEYVAEIASRPIPLIGYCMGGTLSIALAARTSDLISKLVLLAAPWNFETEKPIAGRQNAAEMLAFVDSLPPHADVGVDMLQTFFTNIDPTLSDRKFRAYNEGIYKGSDAEFFSAMEVWANNGPSLARRVARDCMGGWYHDNLTHKNQWQIAGGTVLPEDIECPVWVAAPKADRLVPQQSAFSIVPRLKNAVKFEPPSGHIGMVVGNRAKKGLWSPMVRWLKG